MGADAKPIRTGAQAAVVGALLFTPSRPVLIGPFEQVLIGGFGFAAVSRRREFKLQGIARIGKTEGGGDGGSAEDEVLGTRADAAYQRGD